MSSIILLNCPPAAMSTRITEITAWQVDLPLSAWLSGDPEQVGALDDLIGHSVTYPIAV